MKILDPNRFSISDAAVAPYAQIVDGFCIAYDKRAISKGTSVSLRKEKLLFAEDGLKPALVLDGANFADEWCGLEFKLGPDFEELFLYCRFYPMQHLYPRLYIDGVTVEFDQLDVGDIGDIVRFDRTRIDEKVPGTFTGGNLAFMMPSALWFTVALFEIELKNG